MVEVYRQLGLDRHLLVLGVLGQGDEGFCLWGMRIFVFGGMEFSSLGEYNSRLWGNRILVFGGVGILSLGYYNSRLWEALILTLFLVRNVRKPQLPWLPLPESMNFTETLW